MEQNPLVSSSYGAMIEALIYKGNYKKADSLLEVAIEADYMDKAKVSILTHTARFYINANKLSVAERLCKRALDLLPEYAGSIQTLAFVYELEGEYYEAERQIMALEPSIDEIIWHSGESYSGPLQIGRLYFRQGKYATAEKWFLRAFKKGKNHPPTLRHLGYLYREQQEYDHARQYAEQALKIDSSFFSFALLASILTEGDIDVERGLALARLALEHPPEEDPTDNYIKTKPYVRLPQYVVGLAYFKKQQYEIAIEYIEKAVKLRPHDKTIANILRNCRDRIGG